MTRSYQRRRRKPRLELQQENAQVPQRKNQSRLVKYAKQETQKKDKSQKNEKVEGMTEEELEKRMWEHVKVSAKDPCLPPVVTSEFTVRFPMHRENYIRSATNNMKRKCKTYGIDIHVDFVETTIQVRTTPKTWDPYAIIKARDMIQLIARYVPFEHAAKVLDSDNTFSDIIEIGKMSIAKNQVRFIKRRARLIGPNGVTLRAMELLTDCYILIYGRTVCVIGPMTGIHQVRKIVRECMYNIHPIYELKKLMVKKELTNNENLQTQQWDQFLPSFKRIRNNNRRDTKDARARRLRLAQIQRSMKRKKNHKYTPWPKELSKSKIDLALESGEYWNPEWRNENLKRKNKYTQYMEEEKERMKEQRREILERKRHRRREKKKRIHEFRGKVPEELSNAHLSSSKMAVKNLKIRTQSENENDNDNESQNKPMAQSDRQSGRAGQRESAHVTVNGNRSGSERVRDMTGNVSAINKLYAPTNSKNRTVNDFLV